MSLVLVNRLVLNLQRVAGSDGSETNTSSSFTRLSFIKHDHSILGNIGATLRDGTEGRIDEDEDGSERRVSTEVLSSEEE